MKVNDDYELGGMTAKERELYQRMGGGEAGVSAVKARREYFNQYNAMEREFAREKKRNKFIPRNEKRTVTLPILADIYED